MGCAKRHRIRRWSVRSNTSAHVRRALLPRLVLILTILIFLGTLLQACSGSGGATGFVRDLESITIDPVDSSIAVGTKVQLHATGTYKNKTTKDITDLVTWESADETVVLVSNAAATKGLAGGSGVGVTTVKAKLHGIAGVSTFTVTNASLKSITIQPVNPLVAKGTTVQLAALGNFSDGSVQDLTTQVSWSSANSSIAQVSNTAGTMGLVTGASVGNTPITATFNAIAGSTTVTVTDATLTSITITPPDSPIAKGTTLQATATCNFSDGTTEDCTDEVSWTSADSGIAQVSDTSPTKGLVTGVHVGKTTISASFAGMTGSATVTVSDATLTSITITPDPSIAKGTVVQLTATGNFSDKTTQDLTTQVSWTSSDEAIAQVSNVSGSQGLVTGLASGTASESATLNGIEGSTTVTVTAATLTSIVITPPDSSIAKGTTVQLTATGTFSDGTTQDLTTQASWTSGNAAIAEVSSVAGSEGLLTGVGAGTATITATINTVSASTSATVTAATLNAIKVVAPSSSLAAGSSLQLAAIGFFSDGTNSDITTVVTWSSSADAVAIVSNASGSEGLLTGIAVGNATITASRSGISGTTTISVTSATLSAIAISPATPSVPASTTLPLIATGTFSDGTTQELTTTASWTSSDSTIAEVSNAGGSQGLLSAIAAGTTTITATQAGVSGNTVVTVTGASLTSISVTPSNPLIAQSETLQLVATGTFSDGSTQPLTSVVSWTSNASSVASVSNAPLQQGLVTGLAPGSATITAQGFAGIKGSTTVTVSPIQTVSGQVATGSVPISGSQVTLYEAGSSYGGSPTAISTSTTDAIGKFLFGSFVCPSSNPQVYAVAVGGIPGSATPPSGTDSPIALMAALGPCTALPPTIVINELSTVASTYALARFFNKTVTQHVPSIGTPSTNATGLANGAALITTNLVDLATGAAASFLSSGVNSPANLDSLANILAACVVSNSQLSTPCMKLFSATSISGFTKPVDTMQAILNEALMPANNVSQLFNIQALNAPPLPYQPALSSAPPDWAIALNYTGGGLSGPRRIAMDGVGNAWVSNNTGNSVTELSPTGTALSPATGFQDSSISGPQGIAIDGAGNVWVPSLSSSNLTKLNPAGTVLSRVPALTGGLNMPSSVAIDQLGNAWVANSAGTGQGANSLSKFSSATAALSPASGFTGGGISSPNDVAIDASGNVWVANNIAPTGTISELSPSGGPVAGSPFSGGGLSDCFSVEIDGSGNVWVGNQNPSRLSKFTSTGTAISGSGGIKIGAQPGTKVAGIAIDSTGNVWTANFSGLSSNGVTEIDPTGTVALSGGSGLKELTSSPFGTAIDASGDLWVTNTAAPVNNSVTEYLGVTAPVKTPLIGPPALP
jgi:uncharacterized protein YjdB